MPGRACPSGSRQVWHYGLADWDGLRESFASYPWIQLCLSSNDTNICAEAVADVVLHTIIYSSAWRQNQPWYDKPSAEATRVKQAAFRTWTADRAQKDPNTSNLRKKYNAYRGASPRDRYRDPGITLGAAGAYFCQQNYWFH